MLILGENANYGDDDYHHAQVREVGLTDEARKQGTYVIGTTGTGKTTLLLNLIHQDLQREGPWGHEGLCVLDPHGDFTRDILHRVPEHRVDDVVLFDPTETEYPLGLNLFDCDKSNPRERDIVVSTVIDTLYKLFSYSWGPRMEDLLRHAILSLLLHPEPTTLIHLMLLLVNRKHRMRLTAEAKQADPILRSYWEDQFPESQPRQGGGWRKPREQIELVGSSLNKIGRFIANPIIRHIVGQEYTSFDFRQIMDAGKILLVNLSKGDLGPDNSALLGAVLVNQILIAALSRSDDPFEQRRPFHLYVDEYQTFATKTFPELQSEARKYAIDTVVAHQYRNQLDEENLGSSLNVANVVCLRVAGQDAVDLALQYDLTPPIPEVRFEPIRYEVAPNVWTAEQTDGTGHKLERMVEGPRQPYSDVQLETANLLAQMPNFQGLCRVLQGNTLAQFRVDFPDKPAVDARDAPRIEAEIRAQSRRLARYSREEIARRIAEYTDGTDTLDGRIPAEDVV